MYAKIMNRGKHKQSLDRNLPFFFFIQHKTIKWTRMEYKIPSQDDQSRIVSQGFRISPTGRAGSRVKGHALMFFILPASITAP